MFLNVNIFKKGKHFSKYILILTRVLFSLIPRTNRDHRRFLFYTEEKQCIVFETFIIIFFYYASSWISRKIGMKFRHGFKIPRDFETRVILRVNIVTYQIHRQNSVMKKENMIFAERRCLMCAHVKIMVFLFFLTGDFFLVKCTIFPRLYAFKSHHIGTDLKNNFVFFSPHNDFVCLL